MESSLYNIKHVNQVFNNNSYRLFIADPKSNFNGTTLYLLDGNMHFPKALEAVNSHKPLPRIVAIGYVGEEQYFVPERTRDYTPKAEGEDFAKGGGADNFLNFIANEAKPFIDTHYSKTERNLFFGHSFGGLFGLYTLFTKGGLFDGYILASPSLWWGNSNWLKDKVLTSRPHFVLLTLSEYEAYPERDPQVDPDRIKRIQSRRSDFTVEQLYQQLQNEQISSEFVLLPKVNHGSSIPFALKLALEKAQSQ
ncbi:alpha/beta hydrolase [Otariodibacter oris]|nr:alpha/beta hydrolase-fold protein [Otariodibacter oris]